MIKSFFFLPFDLRRQQFGSISSLQVVIFQFPFSIVILFLLFYRTTSHSFSFLLLHTSIRKKLLHVNSEDISSFSLMNHIVIEQKVDVVMQLNQESIEYITFIRNLAIQFSKLLLNERILLKESMAPFLGQCALGFQNIRQLHHKFNKS